MNLDLATFEKMVQTLTKEELDRDIAELGNEIIFLEQQVHVDLKSYSPSELKAANRKVAGNKRKLEMLKKELARRK